MASIKICFVFKYFCLLEPFKDGICVGWMISFLLIWSRRHRLVTYHNFFMICQGTLPLSSWPQLWALTCFLVRWKHTIHYFRFFVWEWNIVLLSWMTEHVAVHFYEILASAMVPCLYFCSKVLHYHFKASNKNMMRNLAHKHKDVYIFQ